MKNITIKKLTDEEIDKNAIKSWPIWEKEVSKFPWFYEATEDCLIIEGIIEVEANGKIYQLKPGDFVTFQKGLKCTWDIKKPVRKYYNFR
ncbi:MAG: cupin domain-containing protein [Bacteroidales bacterium]|jgi:uncharacterized cupin superfamily protein|nr:cupin domain-containing protein [Bacteroidales bacterium]MDI9592146.1 cupin domain-containing protein [Bacteroidota bacterium]OQC38098.1 MAG: hypothetical protein BWX63_00567 [Bacteroidetes bacterium ADurb.Bin041]MBP7874028.1 cupin domain-containing protein [Bacteroidales bacterium]MCO6467397.1 cupin domain-containing protein [Bacteroidales bacterium]